MPLTIKLTPGYVFAEGDIITPDKLNAFFNMSIELQGAIGSASIAAGAVNTAQLADLAVTAAKIALGTILESNMAPASIGTVELIDASVTAAKLAPDAVPVMVGAGPATNGVAGLAPQPLAGQGDNYLAGDGKWQPLASPASLAAAAFFWK